MTHAILRAALLAGLATFSLPASGEPSLKGSVAVNAPIVTVGDMFEDAGLFAEEALFRAPEPGTVGTVSLLDVLAAAERIGLPAFSSGTITQVRVERLSSTIDQALLSALVEDGLARQGVLAPGVKVETRFSAPFATLLTEASEMPAELIDLRFEAQTGNFSARFAIAGRELPLDVSGTASLSLEVAHLASSLPAGTILRPEHVVMRSVPLRFAEAGGALALEQVVGKALTRPSREGMLVKATDVKTPDLVARNQEVTLFLRVGAMTLTAKGLALNSAAEGEPVAVLNQMSNKIVNGTAVSAATVSVSAGPQAVAGL